MTLRKAPAPLTPANERRLSLRARRLIDNALARSYLDKHIITMAAGCLLLVAQHTGETAARIMTRLRITQAARHLIVRCGLQAECYEGDHPPPVIKRFLEINKTKPVCGRGDSCSCPQQLQRARCEHWQRPARVDPTKGELSDGTAARGALDARAPRKRKMNFVSCVCGDQCTCGSYRERIRCGNWRRDPASRDFAPHNEPWTGDDHAES